MGHSGLGFCLFLHKGYRAVRVKWLLTWPIWLKKKKHRRFIYLNCYRFPSVQVRQDIFMEVVSVSRNKKPKGNLHRKIQVGSLKLVFYIFVKLYNTFLQEKMEMDHLTGYMDPLQDTVQKKQRELMPKNNTLGYQRACMHYQITELLVHTTTVLS